MREPAPESPTQFPQLRALLEGTKEPDLTLGFVDLCGFTSYITAYLADTMGEQQGGITRLITSFGSSLANVAKECPNLKVAQASDGAYLLGQAEDVFDGIVKVMLYAPFFQFNGKDLGFVPMRAAIADGIVRVETNAKELDQYKNLFGFPYWGPAFVKTYQMEKDKRATGIQVFATESVIKKMNADQQRLFVDRLIGSVGLGDHGNEQFFSANWLARVPALSDRVLEEQGLDPTENEMGIKYLARIIWTATKWVENGDNYYKMYGKSILEMRDTLDKYID